MSCMPLNYVSRFHVGEESYRPMTIIYYTKGPFQLTSPTNVTRKGKIASSLSLVHCTIKLHNTTTIFLSQGSVMLSREFIFKEGPLILTCQGLTSDTWEHCFKHW